MTMVGIVSDTHDDTARAKRVAVQFRKAGVSVLLHAGDWVSPFTAKIFEGFKIFGVFGNNDGDPIHLNQVVEKELGGCLQKRFESVLLDDKRVALLHGEFEEIVLALVESGKFDIVVRGHTHTHSIERVGNTLLLNPGADSAIIYDTGTHEARFVVEDAMDAGADSAANAGNSNPKA